MRCLPLVGLVLMMARPALSDQPLPEPWRHRDIGDAQTPGKAELSGEAMVLEGTLDIWGVADGFQFAWQPIRGDVEIVARVASIDNPGGVAHAKASLCIRGTLEPAARNVTLCTTPTDGSQFLYRQQRGGKTVRVFADAETAKLLVPKGQFPCWLKLVRKGNDFEGFESTDGQKWQPSGKITLELPENTVVGLGSSSHKKDILTKCTFDHVKVIGTPGTASAGASGSAGTSANAGASEGAGAKKGAVQAAEKRVSCLTTMNVDGRGQRVVYRTPERIEAPNWSPDGKWLVYNSQGALWRLPADGGSEPERIATGDVKKINNDHVVSPDGQTIYFSALGHLYAVAWSGGEPRRISNDQAPARQFRCWLHGVSPDGQTLAYAGTEMANGDPQGRIDLWSIPAAGGADRRLTDTPAPDDGPEYSPDGRWIYFNSELNATEPGHAQCFRMRPDGTGVEQLTHDERVNWFPHVSPSGRWIVYISFPPGTQKHPANKDVILRRMKPDGSEPTDLARFNGGQGTINVNSWAPDSKRFAYVTYPLADR